MRRAVTVVLLGLAVLLASSAPSLAFDHHWHGGTHVVIGVGPYWYYPYGPYPYWYYPPYPPYYPAPPVVSQDPPVYVQKEPEPAAPAAPAPSQAVEAYWYYCPSAKGYYPSVPSCPESWVKVPPRQD